MEDEKRFELFFIDKKQRETCCLSQNEMCSRMILCNMKKHGLHFEPGVYNQNLYFPVLSFIIPFFPFLFLDFLLMDFGVLIKPPELFQ